MPSVSRAERRVKLCRRRRPWALASSRDELRHSILDHPDRARAPPRTPPESIAGGVRTGGEGGSRGPRRAAGTRTVVTPPHTSTATWRRSSIQRVQRIQTGGARRTGFTISGTIQTNHPPRRAAMAPRRGPQSRDPGPRAGQPGWSPAAARSGPLLDRVQQRGCKSRSSRARARARHDQTRRYDPRKEVRTDVARARTTKLRRRSDGESQGRCLLTNPTSGRGATLRAAGIERRASLVTHRSGSRASRALAKAAEAAESWLKTAASSGGVMTAARREGLYRNWRSPPDPAEKDRGAR